jgi:phenylacetate-coenzyme A ligase PaaK-like adenylate-forming protein
MVRGLITSLRVRRICAALDDGSPLKSLTQLKSRPVQTRAEVSSSKKDGRFKKRQWRQTTSGSSGVPIKVSASLAERYRILSRFMLAYMKCGLKPWQICITIKDPVDISKPNLVQRLGLFRHAYWSIYTPIAEVADEIAMRYGSIKALKGMPSDLASLAFHLTDNEKVFPRVVRIFTDSEKLDHATRDFLSTVFKCPIYDFYAATEVGLIAHQTPRSNGRYVVDKRSVLVEALVNQELDDGDAELVITGLINKTTPIVRYRIGDVASGFETFGGGQMSSYINSFGSIHGKYLDFLVRTDGRIVSSHAAKQNLTHIDGIRRFRVQQRERESLVITIEPTDDWSEKTEKEIRAAFERDFGPEMRINLILDRSLGQKATDYRKFKVVESSVAQEIMSKGAW